MKRYLKDLEYNELKIVFDKNEKLKARLTDVATDIINYEISEYLYCFKNGVIDYNIGYPGNYITVKNERLFIEGLKEIINKLDYFDDNVRLKINLCDAIYQIIDNNVYYNEKNLTNLTAQINKIIEDLKEDLLFYLSRISNERYDDGYLFTEIFLYDLNDVYENFYIDENYYLYEDKTMCYK